MNVTPEVIVILPTYEDPDSTIKTICEISELSLKERVRFLVVEDGSVKTPTTLENLVSTQTEGLLITLSRNIGNQRAIAVGLNYAAENFKNSKVIVMDSDGEDRPDFIPVLLDTLSKDDVDIVVAPRTTRKTNLKFKILYKFYKIFFGILTGKKLDFGNFSALKPRAVSKLVSHPELWMHIGATILNSNLRIDYCPLPRGERYFGISKANNISLIQHGIRSVVVFADRVIVRALIVTSFIFGVTFIFDFFSLLNKSPRISLGNYLWCFSTGLILLLFSGSPKSGNIDIVRPYSWAILNVSKF